MAAAAAVTAILKYRAPARARNGGFDPNNVPAGAVSIQYWSDRLKEDVREILREELPRAIKEATKNNSPTNPH